MTRFSGWCEALVGSDKLAAILMREGFPYELTAHAARVIREGEIPLEWVARVLSTPESYYSPFRFGVLLCAFAPLCGTFPRAAFQNAFRRAQ